MTVYGNVGPANRWYVKALHDLDRGGVEVKARDRTTKEFTHVVTRLPNPRQRVLNVPWRRANPFFQIAEPVWILAGRSDADWIGFFNSQLLQYLDAGRAVFHAPYGERLRRAGSSDKWGFHGTPPIDQLGQIVEQLNRDPGSRRAVATLHNPAWDRVGVETKDRPCNLALSVQRRDNELLMAVFNRSNDLTLGLSYTNIVQFTTIQEVLAAALGIGLGDYTHFSSSYHVYTDDPIAARLRAYHPPDTPVVDLYERLQPTPMLAVPYPARIAWIERLAKTHLTTRTSAQEHEAAVELLMNHEPCPYWRTVCRMLAAWTWLQDQSVLPEDRAFEAADVLSRVEALDWRVAAAEYLHRWERKRNLRTALNGPKLVLGDLADDPVLLAYATHDDGRDA